jgi:hypothetical protein
VFKKKTKMGPKKGRCPLLKVLNFVKGDEIFLQSFSDSQGRLNAREKSILSDCNSISSPNVSLDVIKIDVHFRL